MLANFPNRILGHLLHALVFPFGARHKGPSDALDAEVAALLGRPEGDPALERILDGMYRPQDPEQPLGALKHAFDALAASQGAAKKLAKAMKGGTLRPLPGEHPIDAALTAGALDPAEAEQLRMAELARRKVIDVDDFAKEELTLDEGRIR